MHIKNFHKINAVAVFLISLTFYILTLPDTVVFWDVGEFIAAAYLLQVPHPPGAPFFLLIAKIFSMIPFAADPAVRVHFISALCTALTSMFIYLIVVRLIVLWGKSHESISDKIKLYSSAIIGALSYTFCNTTWFNAVEAEVYGISMFFVSSITYLSLRWHQSQDEHRKGQYILLTAYLIGLSLGVHLLAVLVVFPFLMIIYFKEKEFSISSFIIFGVVAVSIFGVIYPGIVKEFPKLLSAKGLLKFLPWGIILAAIYGVYESQKSKNWYLNIASLSFLFIFLGFTTYTMVIIRANAHTPMNENNPDNLERLVSYLNREQYGEAPLIKRRYSQEPQHQEMYTKYKSDSQFFWQYQIDHMFLRYMMWNYVGRDSDTQDAGINYKQLWAIPLLVGLFGLYFHFKQDWIMGFVFFTFFLLMGLILAIYFNMQDPQPRERDYFYAGAYFIFSIWIGIGVYGLISLAQETLPVTKDISLGIVTTLCFAFIPINMARTNYVPQDRSKDYVAWDYSYNLLQSCEPDAILITNGDNDTFPVWYLQDVEGVRRDIRVVNLSLLNTSWYIKQLKNETPHGAKKVPISISDEQIEVIQPIQWQKRTLSLPLPAKVLESELKISDPEKAKTVSKKDTSITFTWEPTVNFGEITAIRVQDILVYDIIRTNNWKRPIYFAVTSTPDSKIGLSKFMRMDGLAMKLIPVEAPSDEGIIVDSILSENLFNSPDLGSKNFRRGYMYRNLNNPEVTYDDNVIRLVSNYRNAFLRLSLHYLNSLKDNSKAIAVLDSMESKLPRSVIPVDNYLLFDIANFYNYAGKKETYLKLTNEVENKLAAELATNPPVSTSYRNPYTVLMNIYEEQKEFDKAISVLNKMKLGFNDPSITQQIDSRIQQLEAQKSLQSLLQKDTIKK
ncbi:MAG: DUF2723 domain-containing protein [Bacteroidetes bacterium]|nr:DUF2723 domain-containing protein [Bacteroidota bacterium]